MAECGYCWEDEGMALCDLTGSECRCGGDSSHCHLNVKSVSVALRDEEKITLEEASMRAHRKKMREAS